MMRLVDHKLRLGEKTRQTLKHGRAKKTAD